MGMFDWIECKYPLPDGRTVEGAQTKDLECNLDHYTITGDGMLWREFYKWEGYDDAHRPGEFVRFSGLLNFYDDECYFAFFEDGRLQRILTREQYNEERGPVGLLPDEVDDFVKATLPPLVRRDSRE
jgi:hypothetical protein